MSLYESNQKENQNALKSTNRSKNKTGEKLRKRELRKSKSQTQELNPRGLEEVRASILT
jgi:hypothetical protein